VMFLISSSWITRITGMGHLRPANPAFSNPWINYFFYFNFSFVIFTLLLYLPKVQSLSHTAISKHVCPSLKPEVGYSVVRVDPLGPWWQGGT
jgi:hypothetical protein